MPEVVPDPEGDAAILATIDWVEGADGAPVLGFAPPLFVTGPTARLVESGTGRLINEGDTVVFDYAMFAGDTGDLSYSTFAGDGPQTISVQHTGMSQTLADALIGSHVGAKIIFATVDSSGQQPSNTLFAQFMAVLVRDARTPLERAAGQMLRPPAWLPKVTLASDGTPSIGLPVQAGAPGQLISQVLILGDGPVLAMDQTAVVKFSAWLWDGTAFDSTWADQASMAWPMTEGQTMPGLLEGLVGHRMGSQVLVIIPPNKAFNDTEVAGVPPGSTLVYVIDLVDVQ